MHILSNAFFYFKGEKSIIEILSKAQNLSLEDQRGPLDGSKMPFDIPDFLLHNRKHYPHHEIYSDEKMVHQPINLYNYHQIIAPRQHAMINPNSSVVSNGIGTCSQTTMPRSRSPVMIVYDNDDYEAATARSPTVVRNYETISDVDSPFSNQKSLSNKSQISYVWVRDL